MKEVRIYVIFIHVMYHVVLIGDLQGSVVKSARTGASVCRKIHANVLKDSMDCDANIVIITYSTLLSYSY